jgi:hypothetical protein
MELLDLMIEVERFMYRKGLNAYETTVSELVAEMGASLEEDED